MARVLRPGGRLILASINSFMSTSPNAWREDEEGRRLYVPVDNYFGARANVVEWSNISILNWHRPFEDYMEAYLSAGFILEAFREPKPTPEVVAEHPFMAPGLRVPYFHVMRWRKA